MANIQGSCLCGGIRFEADAIDGAGSACHCTMCQKAHGGPFGAYVTLDGVHWLQGEELIAEYRSSEHCSRTFCKTCGSTLEFRDRRKPEHVSMAISALDGDHGGRYGYHIFADDKADWYDINDGLPTYPAGN